MSVNRVERLIINLDMQKPITCNWDDCYKNARTSHQVRLHEHPGNVSCSVVDDSFGMYGRHTIMAFCSESCLDYWVSCSGHRAHDLAARNPRGLIYGQHSAGMKRSAI